MTTATKLTRVDLGEMSTTYAAPDRGISTAATNAAAAAMTSTTAVHAQMTLSRTEKIAAITRVNYLERLLFDADGRLRRHTSPERADDLLWAINDLRRQVGWLRLDMQHHHCWPDNA
jgi:hypothetical protein